jgi:tRNA-2-methylthio-N6-dimethylallyladenosine synthase
MEVIDVQNRLSLESNKKDIGKTFSVLIEGTSKRSNEHWMGRTSQNKVLIFPKEKFELKKGDYVNVKVSDCTQATLLGQIIN